jgi:hypothetical protein
VAPIILGCLLLRFSPYRFEHDYPHHLTDSNHLHLRNQVVSSLVWVWWVIGLVRFEFKSGTFPWFYPIIFLVENHVCLFRGVQVTGAAWRVAMRIVAGVGDLVQRTGDSQPQVEYSVAGWPGGRVTLCAVYTVHEETRSAGFLVEPQNQGRRFVTGLASKSLGRFLPVWPQNWCRRFLPVWPQNRWLQVFQFGPKNR